MSEFRFDGRVAVVTGAGRGIGRGYARLLAARGASVVVNDLGGTIAGDGHDDGPAADAVAEIRAEGGTAIADTNDISTVDGATDLIESAVREFGRIDIVVNNAGNVVWAGMPDVTVEILESHLAVHVKGSFNTIRAAWPHMADRGYGRIVNTTSTGLFGLWNNPSYAAAKGGVIGLTRSLAVGGRRAGIVVNAIAPAAITRMGGDDGDGPPQMAPEAVAPMVGYLAHETCTVTGEIYTAGGGRFARLFIGSTPGHVVDGEPTIEDLAAHFDAVNEETGYVVPGSLGEWSAAHLAHLAPDEAR